VSLAAPQPVLTVLGSGTALPDARRHSSAYHLSAGGARLLLDCGPGTLHGLDEHGVDWAGITHVAISHYHNDHVGDLAALLFAMKQTRAPERSVPLTLIGPQGFGAFLERLAAALGQHVLEPGFPVIVREIGSEAPYEDAVVDLTVRAHPTPHTEESQALTIEGSWGAVGYTGDTGPSEDVARFLGGCDVLVAECALTDPPGMDRHLSPLLVAELARTARPDLLVLTHVYPEQTPLAASERVSAVYQGRVVPARDGMRIVIGADGPLVDPKPAAV
jgi:ribonuclease BN (tRNA processing enzyme)